MSKVAKLVAISLLLAGCSSGMYGKKNEKMMNEQGNAKHHMHHEHEKHHMHDKDMMHHKDAKHNMKHKKHKAGAHHIEDEVARNAANHTNNVAKDAADTANTVSSAVK